MGILFNIAVSSTVTALLILLIKAVFRNKISAKVNFALWLILLIRLMVPVFPESAWSFQNVLPVVQESSAAPVSNSGAQSPGTIQPPALPEQPDAIKKEQDIKKENAGGIQPLMQTVNRTVTIGGVEKEFSVIQFFEKAVVIVWAAGSIAFVAYFIAVYLLFNRKIRAVQRCADTEVLSIFETCKEIVGVNKDIPVKVMENTRPMLKGYFYPEVLIPKGYQREELTYVFVHELFHFKHKDNFFTLLSLLVMCLNWYNPVMWYCKKVFQQDMEVLCDQNVVKLMGNKKIYAQILLKEAVAENHFYPLTTSMGNGKGEIVKRINSIANFKKTSRITLIAFVVCAAVLCAGCLTNSRKPTGDSGVPVTQPGEIVQSTTEDVRGTTTQTTGVSQFLLQGGNCSWFLAPGIEADDIQPLRTDLANGTCLYNTDFDYSRISMINRGGKNGGINYLGEIVIPCEKNIKTGWDGIVSEDMNTSYDKDGNLFGESGGHGFSHYAYDIASYDTCIYGEGGLGAIGADTIAEYCGLENIGIVALPAINVKRGGEYPDYEKIGTYVFVTKDGKLLLETQFEDAAQFREGFAAVKLNGKWGFIDVSGKMVIPFVYDYAYNFSGGIAAVCKDGQWGYIDKNGNIYVPFQFEKARPVYPQGNSAKAWVKKDGKWGIIEIK